MNAKIGDFMDFLAISSCETHLKANCTETNRDRHEQAAYEIFSIERRFRWSKSQFSRFKETCAQWHQRAVPPWKSLFYRCWPVFCENGCR